MNLKGFFDKIRPNFEKGGKLQSLWSLYDGFESFVLVPNATSKSGVSIHDSIDSKRIMSVVVIALMPALLFGMYNVGYQNYLAAGALATAGFWEMFGYGLLAVLPKVLVSYIVGLGIEFAWAQWKHEEIQEGYLVTGIIIPLIIPVTTPLWMLIIAIAFAVIFAKEIFGGTGMNFLNVALVARAFLFFSYPSYMSGSDCWIAFKKGETPVADAFTGATPLALEGGSAQYGTGFWDLFIGTVPGSVGETSVIAILLGAIVLIWTGVASWKVMAGCVGGALLVGGLADLAGVSTMPCYMQLLCGGFGPVTRSPPANTSGWLVW